MNDIKQLKDLFGNTRFSTAKSERGLLIEEFYNKLKGEWKGNSPLSYGYLCFRVSHLKVPDLYYLKSICFDYERRGGIFAKCFWGSIKANKS